MANNVRFESSSASSEDLAFPGNYANGHKGNYPTASLDRSGSFREGSESRAFGSGTSMSRGSGAPMGDFPSLSQWLNLDPITVADQKCTRLGELRRVLGISLGGSSEDSFGAALSKGSPTVSIEELKRFRASMLDASLKARSRAKKLDESLQKLSKYCETLNSKKQINERSGGSNLLKMGSLMQRDLVTPRLEDRAKNVVLNKRIRSSMAEIRAEGRNNAIARLPMLMGKDKEMKDGGDGSEIGEEKIRRLPAGGEGWDRKMKRKRSVGAVFTRSVDGDGEIKRVMQHKLSNEPGVQSFDSQGFRSGSFNGTSCVNKLENTSLAVGSNIRGIPKNEMEKVSLSRDFSSGTTKERIIAKGNNKINIREDNHIVNPGMVAKGKASRASRTSPVMAANSSPSFSRPSGAMDGWEQAPSGSKAQLLGATNNRKRHISAGSSSPPMTQWIGQRLQKMSRTRRTNLVSPVSSHDEVQLPSDGCPSSDLNGRITSGGTNSSLLGRVMCNVTQQIRVKHENVSSPARLSESEESGVGENRDSKLREKGSCSSEVEERALTAVHNVGPSVLLSKKNKILSKEDIGDGVRRQGRSSRGSSFNRTSVSPLREKLDNTTSTKPLKNVRLGTDKNGASKSGRPPLKKVSDRKAFTRIGLTPTSSPDLTGELDDDREELLAAANFACNASYLACSNSFWKKLEPIFASSSFEDTSYLKQQLKLTDELHESLSQIYGHDSNILSDSVHGEGFPSQTVFSGERERSLHEGIDSGQPTRKADLDDQVQGSCTFGGRLCSERKSKVTPLYQRVLSSLIMEDETGEYEGSTVGRNMSSQYNKNNSTSTTGVPVDIDTGKSDRIGLENDSMLGLQDQKQYPVSRSYCNGSVSFDRAASINNELCSEDCFGGGHGYMNSETGMFPELHRNCSDGPLSIETESSDVSSFDCQYEKICLEDKFKLELQSIGIFLEPVPDLADGEDEIIDQEIVRLQKGLQQQVAKKKEHLDKILKAMEEVTNVNERGLEEVAMSRLVELAYKKRMATRGSSASKSGVTKVSKQVAMTFIKRSLARCRKFEETSKSCFSDPAIRDVLFATPARGNDTQYGSCFDFAAGTNMQPEFHTGSVAGRAAWHDICNDKAGRGSFDTFGTLGHTSDQEFAKTGPILNKGKKKEVLLDDVGGISNMRTASYLGNTLLGGTKGKRSERERERDSSIKNSVAKSGRATLVNFKGERKTKSKPKQKTAQLTSSGNGFVNKLTETTDSVYSSTSGSRDLGTNDNDKKRVGFHDSVPPDSSQEFKEPIELQLQDFDSIGLGGDWLNFDDDGLQDHEDGLQDTDLMGLEIPMDDLSELNMF